MIDQVMSMQEFLLCAKNNGADPEVLKQRTGGNLRSRHSFSKSMQRNKTVIGCDKNKEQGEGLGRLVSFPLSLPCPFYAHPLPTSTHVLFIPGVLLHSLPLSIPPPPYKMESKHML